MAETSCPRPDGTDTAAGATAALPAKRGTRNCSQLRGGRSSARGRFTHGHPPGSHSSDGEGHFRVHLEASTRVALQKLHLNHGHYYFNVICTKISSSYLLGFSPFDQLLLSGVLGVSRIPTEIVFRVVDQFGLEGNFKDYPVQPPPAMAGDISP